MRATFPQGWVWVGGESDDAADAWTRGAYATGKVRTVTLTGRAGAPTPERRCVLQHAWQTGKSASFTCLGASLLPGPDQLRIEVVAQARGALDGALVEEILDGALAGARASDVPGVLRFDRGLVLVVDLDPALYRRAARVITELLAGDLAALSQAALGERAAALWSAGDVRGRG